MELGNLIEQSPSIHVRHFQIAQDQCESAVLEVQQCFFAGSGKDDVETIPPEHLSDQLTHILFVVYHQTSNAG